jgi:hypothetical protein
MFWPQPEQNINQRNLTNELFVSDAVDLASPETTARVSPTLVAATPPAYVMLVFLAVYMGTRLCTVYWPDVLFS